MTVYFEAERVMMGLRGARGCAAQRSSAVSRNELRRCQLCARVAAPRLAASDRTMNLARI